MVISGRELRLRECPTDMENIRRQFALFPESLTKRDFSDSLWTKFSPCRTWPKLAEYEADNKVIMKELI